MRLDDVREVLAIHSSGEPPCATVRGTLDTRIAEIDAAIAELRALRSTLMKARHRADRRQAAALVCGVIEDTPIRDLSS